MILQSKIFLTIGFLTALFAYSYAGIDWEMWTKLMAFSFVCYTRVIYLQSHGFWSICAFIVWLTTVSSLLDELFFDPTEISLYEYIAFSIIIIITFKYKKKWTRSKEL